MDRYRFRSPLGRASGLGSAKAGFTHWWIERITAVALVPLTVWFAASLIAHSGRDYQAFLVWAGAPITTVLMILLLIALFWHMALGLQVVIEDYIHTEGKIWALLAMRFLCVGLAVVGIVATLSIAFGQ
jgi:succinate dehydrogenase / fumarate reductase membrane anchor subunit